MRIVGVAYRHNGRAEPKVRDTRREMTTDDYYNLDNRQEYREQSEERKKSEAKRKKKYKKKRTHKGKTW